MSELRPNDGPPRLIMNQVGVPKRPEISVADFVRPLDIQPAAIIPFDPALFGTASNNGQMISEADAKSPIAGPFRIHGPVAYRQGRTAGGKEKRTWHSSPNSPRRNKLN